MGWGDIAINALTNRMAILPARNNVAYHLFDLNSQTLLRRTSWQAYHSGKNKLSCIGEITPDCEIGCIDSFDFDFEGEMVAVFDDQGMLVVSNVNTNKHLLDFQLEPSNSSIRDFLTEE